MLLTVLYASVLVSLLGTVTCNNKTLSRTVDVSRKCPDVLHRVDYVKHFWVQGAVQYNNSDGVWWRMYQECRVTFETTQDQGLCFDMKRTDINAEGVTLDFLTTAYRPEKHYEKDLSSGSRWCTHKNQVTMVVRLPQDERYLPPAAFRFRFQIKNKTLDQIQKVYNMGSPAECDMHYILQGKETAIIKSQLTPPSDPAPEVCKMTFTSLSKEEYGQVCVSIESFESLPDCDMELELIGMDLSYWSEDVVSEENTVETGEPGHVIYDFSKITDIDGGWVTTRLRMRTKYDCNTRKNTTKEVCSGDKVLTLKLKRGRHIDSARFELKIASKWMSYWESAENIKTEISVLNAAKSLTYLIATLDTVVALAAAFISIATRYPYGRLKVIGDVFGKDPTVPHHYGNDLNVT